ncbi:hypothetical protein BC939DRAFT_158624 [Gamsiella multidivaricata]|uniref:uncharacterized protein n=1 Tax=Gamsiella multidivaricata TaxID=101098 RepID=UPI0022201B72|nr:uncharacterized protein BC939DRAFT_158624 [Gamsiella multidivaricata]KAI7823521.1 hypothetical protein BC939DRAFT_158624 [Gamsiella multidivaricata]
MKGMLSDVDGLTMIDGEKAGLESGKRRDIVRKVDVETPTPREQSGRTLDLVARDTTNKRDWFVVENLKEWDEMSTKFLREVDVTLFKDLHLIASHRLREQPSIHFRSQARFFAIYSGGKPFNAIGLFKRLQLESANTFFRSRFQDDGDEGVPLQCLHYVIALVRLVPATLHYHNMEAPGPGTRPPIASQGLCHEDGGDVRGVFEGGE